jgi:thiol-disulfide isomerase/thioredoxin
MVFRIGTLAVVAACAAFAAEPAPRFSGKTMDGERFTSETLKGKTTLIQFWATWCGYCRKDQAAVDTVTREFAGRGLVVLAVNFAESRGKVKAFLEESPRACKIVLTEDTNLVAIFRPDGFPFYVLIGKDGAIAGVQDGAGGEEGLRELLAKAGLSSR